MAQQNYQPGTFEMPPQAEPIEAEVVYANTPAAAGAPQLGPTTGAMADVLPQPSPLPPVPPRPDAGASAAPGTISTPGFWAFMNQPVAFGIPVWAVAGTVVLLGISYYLFFVKDAKPSTGARKPVARKK